MHNLRNASVLFFIVGNEVVHGSTHSTKWTLRNEAKDPISLSCKNISVEQVEIALPEQTIPAGGQSIYDWGDGYYNDGLWLNAGKWSCSLQAHGKTAGVRRTETFSTDWGETITLVLSRFDDQVRMKKIPSSPPLATKDQSKAKPTGSK
ncbi:MAG TPA: hypothetical protein VE954_23315 [Oligoflexus sp.]|uniref:hypothetical protein n=1 Tax=Oligoflexus sp. TaxID=1971216 RepID=UPI002D4A1D28|nr:hypothetical protein [Oligoflexus sp.]HYX36042.1 hypothetical protein [Oligoflexus sp.]